jgi:pseudo-rSAM protein
MRIFLGKLIVFPNGDVYANINFPSIGNLLEQKLTQIVYNEISNPSNAWFMTRDRVDTCKQCINRYLCPSLSNYEITTKVHNMCYLNISN